MGHSHQQPKSSGILVAIIGVGLVLAILGIVVVAAIGLFWVRTARVESLTAVVAEQRAIAELHKAEAEAQQAVAQAHHEEATAQLEQSRFAITPDSILNCEVHIDQEGNASIDGEKIGLDVLKTRLAELKNKTNNPLSVRINADPECPAKFLIPVLDVCEDVGDIDFAVVVAEIGKGNGIERQ